MPEIPEIETVRRHLENKVIGQTISSVTINREKSINVPIEQFQNTVSSQHITVVQRRAKQIIMILSNNKAIIVHFMLDGYMRFFSLDEKIDKPPSVLLGFENGSRLGLFKINLGYVHLVSTIHFEEMSELKDIGPEPLSSEFTINKFMVMLENRKGMVKPLLMDQNFIAGIGNVYSNEILFCSRIKPTRKIKQVSFMEKKVLYNCIRDTLQRALDLGGVNDERFSSDDNLTGGFIPYLKVAYRTGKPCLICGRTIVTKRVGGRNAFFCPSCQQ